MPFVRFSRDKRGYEHVYLFHADDRGGRGKLPRVLYWFRSPPGVRVGREPFDEPVQRALEAAYPGVVFDWKRIKSTPMPAPQEAEMWRERRRAERAARRAPSADALGTDGETPERQAEAPDATESSTDAEGVREAESETEAEAEGEAPRGGSSAPALDAQRPRGRRRRRHRRRRLDGGEAAAVPPGDVANPAAASVASSDAAGEVGATGAEPASREGAKPASREEEE